MAREEGGTELCQYRNVELQKSYRRRRSEGRRGVPDPLGSFLLSEQTTVDLRSDMGKDLPAAVIPLYFPVEILAGRGSASNRISNPGKSHTDSEQFTRQ